jgi:hypothetical protein
VLRMKRRTLPFAVPKHREVSERQVPRVRGTRSALAARYAQACHSSRPIFPTAVAVGAQHAKWAYRPVDVSRTPAWPCATTAKAGPMPSC